MTFDKPELLTIRDILQERARTRLYRYTNETGDNIDKEVALLDKVIRMIVACEIDSSKEIVYNLDGSKK